MAECAGTWWAAVRRDIAAFEKYGSPQSDKRPSDGLSLGQGKHCSPASHGNILSGLCEVTRQDWAKVAFTRAYATAFSW